MRGQDIADQRQRIVRRELATLICPTREPFSAVDVDWRGLPAQQLKEATAEKRSKALTERRTENFGSCH